MRDASPLRYPGGKWRLTPFLTRLISSNFKLPPRYAEPYVGGGGLALSLLFGGAVREIFLNDLDPAIYAFWISVTRYSKDLIDLLLTTPVTPAQWKVQKEIYRTGSTAGHLKLGFSTFFLNRTNHSGILNGGMIGGKEQSGNWRLDARYNRNELARRIQRIAAYKSRIHVSNQDACDFVRSHPWDENSLVYLDPPYYHAGKRLYLNHYHPPDHGKVRDAVKRLGCPWVVSYDDTPQIRSIYAKYRHRSINLLHTARTARMGNEVIFFSPLLSIPRRRGRNVSILV
jgi:DNA adenine methylase